MWQKSKRKLKKNKTESKKTPKTPLVCVAHVLLCCIATTSTARCVVTPLVFFFSPKTIQPNIYNIYNSNKKNYKHNPIGVHKMNIEVQKNEPQQLLQGARDCLCCIFPLCLASLRPNYLQTQEQQ